MNPLCPYCGLESKLVDSSTVYRGVSYGMIFDCRPCDAYVGVHKNSGQPLGSLADRDLRIWRMKAHKAFDPLWKTGKMSRKDAYQELRQRLGLTPEQGHISRMDVAQCQRVAAEFSTKINSLPPVSTFRTDFSLPDCGCTHVAPWEHCEHTEKATA